ncbi:MAG: RNA polymerase sigma factor [Ktedonobacterales bacterium]
MQQHPRALMRLSHDEFARLVDQHQLRLHAYLAGLLGHTEQAFDLVQETFYDAWRAAQDGTPPLISGAAETEVRRWLFRAGSNNALTLLRRRRLIRWESLESLREPLLDGHDAFDEQLAEHDALQSALDTLSPQDVACLLLRVVHGFSAAETGLILDTSADNVNNRLARAKQRLRAAYSHHAPHRREAHIPS